MRTSPKKHLGYFIYLSFFLTLIMVGACDDMLTSSSDLGQEVAGTEAGDITAGTEAGGSMAG